MRFCTHPTEMSGMCRQVVFDSKFLRRLRAILSSPVDVCYYHAKLALEVCDSPTQYLTADELAMTMGGRPHGDGRRLDQYVLESNRTRQVRV